MRWLFLLGMLGLIGCEPKQDPDVATALSVANEAYAQAEQANSALDEGVASGTTMGDELQEATDSTEAAAQEAREAKDIATQAWNKAADLEQRIDTICQRAPSACY